MKGKICRKEKKIRYSDLFWLFFFGSILGFILEGVWQVFKKGEWENHSATILGPFCIIYGAGAALLYLASKLVKNHNCILLFTFYAVLGTVLEFFASLLQERLFGSASWSYKNRALNIGGRVCLEMSLIWGVLGLLFALFIIPRLDRTFSKMRGPVWNFTTVLLSIFMVFNLAVSTVAALRFGERMTHGCPPSNKIEAFFDKNYDNDTMNMIFSNLNFLEKS